MLEFWNGKNGKSVDIIDDCMRLDGDRVVVVVVVVETIAIAVTLTSIKVTEVSLNALPRYRKDDSLPAKDLQGRACAGESQ